MTSTFPRAANNRWRLDKALPGGGSGNGPWAGHKPWLAARSACIIMCGIAVLLLIPGDNGFVAAATLLVASLLQPLVLLFASRLKRTTAFALSDLVLIFAWGDFVLVSLIVAIEPETWAAGLFIIGTLLGWQSLTAPWQTTARLALTTIVGMTAAGIFADIHLWVLGPVAVLLIVPVLARLGLAIREEIHTKESDLSITLSSAGAVVGYFDLETRKSLTIEGDIEALTGWTSAQWEALDYESLIHPDDHEGYWIDATASYHGHVRDRTCRLRRPDGSWTWIRDNTLVSVDRKGRRSARWFATNITEIQEATQLIERQAMEDSLTGLANRRRLHLELDQLHQASTPLALIMIDLDLFKKVNDSLGHEAGDLLLQFVANQLRDLIGDEGFVARLGGDEFAIVYPDLTSEADATALVAEIRSATSEPVTLTGVPVSASLSIGVDFSDGSVDGTTLLRHADIAMYEAKRNGLDYQVFDLTLVHNSTMALSLGSGLRAAIETEELQLSFQPKYNLATGAVVGAAGLIRWHHPQFGVLTPDKFLDLTMLSEQNIDFALLTVEQATRLARRILDAGRPMPIAVNVAMRVLGSSDFGDATSSILRRHNVPPEFLILEINEDDAGWPTSQVTETIQTLRAAGITLSIGDFGTGQSSLERLRSLRVDEVKIDRAFVSRLDQRPVEQELVATMIDLAGRLGYDIVAQGVERQEEADLLQAMGCVFAQGDLFSSELSADEFFVMATDLVPVTEPPSPRRNGHGPTH